MLFLSVFSSTSYSDIAQSILQIEEPLSETSSCYPRRHRQTEGSLTFCDGMDLNLCHFLWKAVQNSECKSWYSRGLARATKKSIRMCFWVCGWTRNGWCSLSPWIVCHSHYFLSLPFPLSQKVWTKMAIFSPIKDENVFLPFVLCCAETKNVQ